MRGAIPSLLCTFTWLDDELKNASISPIDLAQQSRICLRMETDFSLRNTPTKTQSVITQRRSVQGLTFRHAHFRSFWALDTPLNLFHRFLKHPVCVTFNLFLLVLWAYVC